MIPEMMPDIADGAPPPVAQRSGSGPAGVDAPRVRRDFPETWLWTDKILGYEADWVRLGAAATAGANRVAVSAGRLALSLVYSRLLVPRPGVATCTPFRCRHLYVLVQVSPLVCPPLNVSSQIFGSIEFAELEGLFVIL